MCISSKVSHFFYVNIISKHFSVHTLQFITDFVFWFLYSQKNLQPNVSIYLFTYLSTGPIFEL